MKVLFLTNYPVPYRVDFFNELGKYCDLTVLYEQQLDEIYDRNQIGTTDAFNMFKGEFYHGVRIKIGCYYLNFDVLRWVKKARQFDVVIFGIYSSPTQAMMITIMKLFRRNYVISSDGGFIKNDRFIARKIKNFLIGKAALYLASGESTKQYLEYYGADPKRVYIYPFTSLKKKDVINEPASKETKKKLREQYGIFEKRVVLGVGQLIDRKGWDVLLEAAQGIPMDVGIYIIGGTVTEEYRRLINQYGLRSIHFIPFMEKEELSDYYMLSDLFILPTREDIWGLVINEAMAHGLPVITTKSCLAGLELIEDGVNGFLVDRDNVTALADRMNRLLQDDELCMRMAENNLSKIQAYTIEEMAAVTAEILSAWLEHAQ